MFSSPFPASIAFVCRRCADGDFERLPQAERQLLSPAAAEKRRAQFANGRLAAAEALTRLGLAPAPIVTMGARGEPIWPPEMTGSITHCADWAAVAAARAEDAAAIGIDIERCDRELRHDISKRICEPSEIAWAEQAGAGATARIIALFSAKESIYKALYHLTGEPFRFKKMLLAPNAGGGFDGTLAAPIGTLSAGYPFNVGVVHSDGYVFTHLALPPSRL